MGGLFRLNLNREIVLGDLCLDLCGSCINCSKIESRWFQLVPKSGFELNILGSAGWRGVKASGSLIVRRINR